MKSGWRAMVNKFTDSIKEAENGQSDTVPGAADVFGLGNLPERRSRQVVEREVVVYQTDPNAIQRHDDGSMTYKRFTMTPVGLIVPDQVTIEELLEVEEVLENLETSIQWNIGDWYNSATDQNVWGRKYELQPASEVEYKYQTLADYAWVARSIHFSIRNRKLSFGHHRVIAPLAHDLQALWLEYAATRTTKLKISSLKEDMKRLAPLSFDNQVAWLQALIPIPDARFIQYDELKPEQVPSDVKQIKEALTKNAAFIANTWQNAENLAADTRETAIQIAHQQAQMIQQYLSRLRA